MEANNTTKRISSFGIVSLDLTMVSENKYFKKTNGICELCKNILEKKNVVVGNCGHAFHRTCVDKILSQNTTMYIQPTGMLSCPVDNIAWGAKKFY